MNEIIWAPRPGYEGLKPLVVIWVNGDKCLCRPLTGNAHKEMSLDQLQRFRQPALSDELPEVA